MAMSITRRALQLLERRGHFPQSGDAQAFSPQSEVAPLVVNGKVIGNSTGFDPI
jgi:hypothetical protein